MSRLFGQCIIVVASLLGEKGRVTAIDVAPPEYGRPITLGQSQEHILQTVLGPRINFQRTELQESLKPRLASERPQAAFAHHLPFDAAILCHSLWYFDSGEDIRNMFAALAKSGMPRIYMAEWKGEATNVHQEAHCLAVHAQSYFHSQKPRKSIFSASEPNVRAAYSAGDIHRMAEAEGWRIVENGSLPSPQKLMDGYWECQYVTSQAFQTAIAAEKLSLEAIEQIGMYVQMVRLSTSLIQQSKLEQATSMDVVWSVLEQ